MSFTTVALSGYKINITLSWARWDVAHVNWSYAAHNRSSRFSPWEACQSHVHGSIMCMCVVFMFRKKEKKDERLGYWIFPLLFKSLFKYCSPHCHMPDFFRGRREAPQMPYDQSLSMPHRSFQISNESLHLSGTHLAAQNLAPFMKSDIGITFIYPRHLM